MQKKGLFLVLACFIVLWQGAIAQQQSNKQEGKIVVYQVFTRLFGNTNTTNRSWGTIEENGVGKFGDFTDKALQELKGLGVTHIWYTGIPHHALVRDYTAYGISNDDPDVVKGRAGSPYAVKDYYNVNPDLATDPAKRLEEFEALIARTHAQQLKVIIDIVPNHIARRYQGKTNPAGVRDFGADDNKTVEYARDNNFYYIPNSSFEVPTAESYKPLGGEAHPLVDAKFDEVPAKWTGNGSRLAKPDFNDWYETVKINYGIKPDGTKDFPTLPADYAQKDYKAHYVFWQDKSVPSSWVKFRDIALYWVAKGVDGFRYDMAEMVPVEFWSYMNSSIKMKNPEAFLLAEIYNPAEYRNYIHLGKMDYLYDKVDLYDRLKDIVQDKAQPAVLTPIATKFNDINQHLLTFLENHDEQRLSSMEFAGDPMNGKPLMVVTTTLYQSPVMIYFGQEVGEKGAEKGGFGSPSRTSIFDYVGVPAHQRWMNNKNFDGGALTEKEKQVRDFYQRLLTFARSSSALTGEYLDLHQVNLEQGKGYNPMMYAYARWSDKERVVVITNFNKTTSTDALLVIPSALIKTWGLGDGSYVLTDVLYGKTTTMQVKNGQGQVVSKLLPNESVILKVK